MQSKTRVIYVAIFSQVILRTLIMNVSLDEAIDEPRILNNLLTNKAYIESGFSQVSVQLRKIQREINKRGHNLKKKQILTSLQQQQKQKT